MKSAEVLESRHIFAGRIVNLRVDRVRLPNGNTADMEIVAHSGAVAVVAIDDRDHVLLVRQYRHATGEWLLEIPAGTLDPGEPPVECVARELEEETGYRPGSPSSVEALGWIWPTPGFSDEKIWLFLVTGLVSGEQKLDDDEVLSVVRMPWSEALAAARDGSITDGKSVCALLRAGAKRRA